MEIDGKTAIVTGGASGLGRATVNRLVAEGARVAIFDVNEEEGAAALAELGEAVVFERVDVADEADVGRGIARTREKFGALHICCNFAGIGPAAKTFGKKGPHSLELFSKVIQVNLVGTFNVLRLAAAEMSRNDPFDDYGGRGAIINTASVAAFEGQMGQVAYSASKGGVVAMTVPVARDLAEFGIRVNAIAPGIIDTPMLRGLPENVRESLGKTVLYPQRLGRAEEIAQLAVDILRNDYLNAEVIRLDGGIRMQPR